VTEPSLPDKVVALDAALDSEQLPHAFGGALALAYYGEPRTTVDIDVNVFVGPDRYHDVASVLRRLGADRLPSAEQVAKDGQCRLWWGRTPIDLFFAYDPVHVAMQAALRHVPFGDATIPVLAPEHLVVAKAVFDRPKDWLDIEQVLLGASGFNVAEVRRWLEHLIGKEDPRLRRFRDLSARLLGGPGAP
jgi:hypothetical protein